MMLILLVRIKYSLSSHQTLHQGPLPGFADFKWASLCSVTFPDALHLISDKIGLKSMLREVRDDNAGALYLL